MAARVRTVEIPDTDRRELKRRARSKGAPARVVERARIVLLAGDGVPGKQIAAISLPGTPSAASSTIRARSTTRAGAPLLRARRCNSRRSASGTSTVRT